MDFLVHTSHKMASIPFMPFLRPLPPPCLSSISMLRRQISSLPRLCQQGNGLPVLLTKCPWLNITILSTAAPITSKAQSLPPASPTIKSSAQVDPAALPPLPYYVHRTASQKLPIYHLAKRGGNLHQTRIRKIEGDVEKLREEIVATLALREETVVINRLTGHIIIKVR